MIVIVVDSYKSALGFSALARQEYDDSVIFAAHSRFVDSKMEILAANEFMTPFTLLKAIRERNPTAIFFAWRGALLDALNYGWRTRNLLRGLNDVSIGILIPDLVGLEIESRIMESKLIDLVDYYMVTSKDLYSQYTERFPEKLPAGLYRDMPDLELLQEVKNQNLNQPMNRVIWVGNSKWGAHHGAIDHKGFNQIVIPLKNELREVVEFKLIDSSAKRQSHEQVLQEIRKSKVLVQTSKAEGTGLPLLEAAGLGAVVVTTDVGIASDFLKGDLRQLIVERNIESFSAGIEYAFKNYQEFSKVIQERFESYIEEISLDSLPLPFSAKSKDLSLFSNKFDLLVKLKWFRRWLLAKK
jgi:hypothetical protein